MLLSTLIHEMIHPFFQADFPDVPAWLNEGLASLYERAKWGRSPEGHPRLLGATNWRLRSLQRLIKDKAVPPFPTLFSLRWERFYEDDIGDNYAQSRFLCQYLQEQDKLIPFYRTFRERFYDAEAPDLTGLASLQATLNEPDIAAFQRRWEAWAAGLKP